VAHLIKIADLARYLCHRRATCRIRCRLN